MVTGMGLIATESVVRTLYRHRTLQYVVRNSTLHEELYEKGGKAAMNEDSKYGDTTATTYQAS